MLAGLVLKPYRLCVEKAFCEVLLATRYVSPFPNPDRFARFLTRLKSDNPELDNPELCQHGLPDFWAYIQFKRGPLVQVEEDDFRSKKIRTLVDEERRFEEIRYSSGAIDLDFWLFANNQSAIEACESWYYSRLYKIKSISYDFLGFTFKSRVIHESLTEFDSYAAQGEHASGFFITWRVQIRVPLLTDELQGYTVLSNRTDIYDRSDEPRQLSTFPSRENIPDEINNSQEDLSGYLEQRRGRGTFVESVIVDEDDQVRIIHGTE